MKNITHSLLVAYLVGFLVFVTPISSFSFTIGEEREVGEKLFYAARANFEIIDDPDLYQYIEKIGKEVIDIAGVQFFDYHFFIINNKEFNAFAAPSGLIFFHTGLIETMDSEDELVSVIAHEIGHITKRHISSRIDKGKKITLGTMGLLLASLALGGGAATQALFVGSIAAGQSASLHYSRLDEEEADLLAYGWMKELKRNPRGQERMLQTMRQISRYRSGMVPQYLLTHPNPEARLDYVQSLIASENSKNNTYNTNDNFDFLRFKFRIMTQVKDGNYLRGYYSAIISDSKSLPKDIIMAKYGIAQLERAENNYEASLQLMDEVIGYYQNHNILYIDKGLIEFESGDIKRAYKTLVVAYDNNRGNMHATFALGRVCYELGMIAKAESLYRDVMFTMPTFSRVYFELGKLSAARGKQGEASYYLGKYYLYEGKLEISRKNLQIASQHDETSKELKLDTKRSLDLIDRLEK